MTFVDLEIGTMIVQQASLSLACRLESVELFIMRRLNDLVLLHDFNFDSIQKIGKWSLISV